MQRNTGTGIAFLSVPVLCFRAREAHKKTVVVPEIIPNEKLHGMPLH